MKFMELIGLFKEGTPASKSHMKNLLEIAMADSHFDDREYELLKRLAKKHGVSKKELQEIQENPTNVDFELPDNDKEKFEQYYELVHMMGVDDDVHDLEMNLCKIFAKKFGYREPDELAEAVSSNIRNGTGFDETMKRVSALL